MIKAKASTNQTKMPTPAKKVLARVAVKKTASLVAVTKAKIPTKKMGVTMKLEAVVIKKEPVLIKKPVLVNKEFILKNEPVSHILGKRLQTAEGWKRSMVAKKTTDSRKTKKI